MKLSLLTAVQEQVLAVVTFTLPLPPANVKSWPGADNAKPLTVKVTGLEVAGGAHVPLITTSYEFAPPSAALAGLMVRVWVVAPEMLPPSASGAPFLRHWRSSL